MGEIRRNIDGESVGGKRRRITKNQCRKVSWTSSSVLSLNNRQ